MEIKKGISQMAEYPNVEINYVVPKSGNMHYVLKDGVLENGVIIATLDPRHAIDEANPCQNIGAFSVTGDILVDFNKKDIKRITDNLLLVVNSVPVTNEVATPGDMTAESNKDLIVQMMMQEMGPTGEMIFEDPYSEANVYATDSYNNKLGLDCSFIGKNNEGLYFHTNDVNSLSKFIKVDEFGDNGSGSQVDSETLESTQNEENQTNDGDLQLNINPTILGGFNLPQDVSDSIPQSIEEPSMDKIKDEEDNSGETNSVESEPELVPQIETDESTENNEETEINVEDTEEGFNNEPQNESDINNVEEDNDEEQTKDNIIEDEDVETSNDKEELVEEKESSNDEKIEEDASLDDEEIEDDNSSNEITEEDDSTEDEDYDDTDYEDTSDDDDIDDDYEYNSKYNYDDEEDDDMEMEKPRRNRRKSVSLDDTNNDTEVLDDAIELINKMMEETDKLNRRIKKLETKLEQKDKLLKEQKKLIEEQDNKKNELNSLLNKANRLLDNIG